MIRTLALWMIFLSCLIFFSGNVWARKLPPADFEEMYNVAASGDLGALMAASRRGLDLDARNKDGDTGLCMAVKRGNYLAYNTFIKAGAHNHPPCVNRMPAAQYQKFIDSSHSIKYSQYPRSFAPRESDDWSIIAVIGATIAAVLSFL